MSLEKASTIQSSYNAALRRINADKKLSDEGRRIAIAKAYRTAKTDMDAARSSASSDIRSRRASLLARAYGNQHTAGTAGTSVIELRDAEDRATKLTSAAEAQAAFDRAEERGDHYYASAIARHAEGRFAADPFGNKSWLPVLQSYVDARPQLADVFDELSQIDEHIETGHFRTTVHYNVHVPNEIRDVANNPTRLDAVADSA